MLSDRDKQAIENIKDNLTKLEWEFLDQSNAIEGEFGEEAYADAEDAYAYAKYCNNQRLAFDANTLLEIHRRLMQRLNPRIAGKFRDCTVYVGNHIAPKKPEQELRADVNINLAYIHKGRRKHFWSVPDREKHAKKTHVEFEKIHPFEDGNGRVGRILWQIHRSNLDLPMKVIYDADKHYYYRWFK